MYMLYIHVIYVAHVVHVIYVAHVVHVVHVVHETFSKQFSHGLLTLHDISCSTIEVDLMALGSRHRLAGRSTMETVRLQLLMESDFLNSKNS